MSNATRKLPAEKPVLVYPSALCLSDEERWYPCCLCLKAIGCVFCSSFLSKVFCSSFLSKCLLTGWDLCMSFSIHYPDLSVFPESGSFPSLLAWIQMLAKYIYAQLSVSVHFDYRGHSCLQFYLHWVLLLLAGLLAHLKLQMIIWRLLWNHFMWNCMAFFFLPCF